MKVLFVCTGNTCRSPMAEGILKHLLILDELEVLDNNNISSAGLYTIDGIPANEHAVKAMQNFGIDISEHKSRQLTYDLIVESDLILTMTMKHKDFILLRFPESENKTFALKEYPLIIENEDINGSKKNYNNKLFGFDIIDPYGESKSIYENTAQEIYRIIDKIIKISGGKIL